MTEKTLDVKVGGPLADLLHDMAFALTSLDNRLTTQLTLVE